MSGVKRMNVVAGGTPEASNAALAARGVISATGTGAALAAKGVISASGAVITAGAIVAMVPIRAAQAYQERARREREKAVQREQEIQKRIAEIRAQAGRASTPKKVTVNISDAMVAAPLVGGDAQPKATSGSVSSSSGIDPDVQRRVQDLQSRLPGINTEYQSLVSQQLLDSPTVSQALEKTQQALNKNDLSGAEAYLKALDDARIQVLTEMKAAQKTEAQYVQERLDILRDRLPQAVAQPLQAEIDQVQRHGSPPDDPDLLVLHQKLSDYEAQIECVAETATHLLNSWVEVGYAAHLSGIDNGDLILTVETHEGANTEMRVQFEGQEVVLNGPAEETASCSARTRDMFQLFQQQGYYLEWESLDGQPVPEEWRSFYSAEAVDTVAMPAETEITVESETLSNSASSGDYVAPAAQRRSESQGY